MPFKEKADRLAWQRKWNRENRDRIRTKTREYHLRVKMEVFSVYCKGDIKCACCGERHVEFLCIDHINGGGTKHRAKIGHHHMYIWLMMNSFPDGYRILCNNCNQAIGAFGCCPHEKEKNTI